MKGMRKGLPDIPPEERTPLVVLLLEIINQQQEEIQRLRDEIAILKGQKPKPQIKPSRLEQPSVPPQSSTADNKRPGSAKRSKNAQLTIHREIPVLVADAPSGSVVVGYEDYIVQELVFQPQVTRYVRQRVRTPDGQTVLAPLPAEVLPGQHYGPTLISYILYQYHHNHVTQPLLLEELEELGIAISAGQLNRILTEGKDSFHQEKEALLPVGLEVSSYVGVDDTGARHQGKNGYCTVIGNDCFAYFASTASKSRLNFLEILRGPHSDYVINDVTVGYLEQQRLSKPLVRKLCTGPQEFADEAAWQARLAEVGITGERRVRLATEGALLGSVIAHGVSTELVILSDGAPQFEVLVHAACWIHAERGLARLIPFSEPHRIAIEKVREQIWVLYQDLKAYRTRPDAAQAAPLAARFDALVNQKTSFPSINGVLKEMRDHKADLLRVLERPEVPLHNNTSESHVRDYVKKRKISGSTRSEAGRRCRDTFASLKKTCRCLAVPFWTYLLDRVKGLGKVAQLADLVRQRARELTPKLVPAVPTK